MSYYLLFLAHSLNKYVERQDVLFLSLIFIHLSLFLLLIVAHFYVFYYHYNILFSCTDYFGRNQVHWMSEHTKSIFLAGFAGQKDLKKNPTVWVDGGRPLTKSLVKL